MKRSFITFSILIMAVLIASCSSGVDASRSIGLESGAGAVISDGGYIDPTQDIEVSFASAPGQVLAAMICYEGDEDVWGEIIDLTIIPLDALNVRVVPTNGSYPQKKRCELAISAFGEYYTYTLNTSCAPGDDFTNSATYDATAAPYEYGSGCWKTVGSEGVVVEQLNGLMLVYDFADPTGNVVSEFYKHVSGGNYTAEFAGLNIVYDFDTTLGRDEVLTYALLISQSYQDFNDGVSPGIFVGYHVKYDDGTANVVFECVASGSNFTQTVVEDCGDGSASPNVGFIRDGQVFTPYYSFDGGTTKELFELADGGTNYDMSAFITADEEMDIGMMTIGDHVGVYGSVSVGELIVTGDAGFVAE
jgi:hypothetical protein